MIFLITCKKIQSKIKVLECSQYYTLIFLSLGIFPDGEGQVSLPLFLLLYETIEWQVIFPYFQLIVVAIQKKTH